MQNNNGPSTFSYSEDLFHSIFQHMGSCVAIYAAVGEGEDFTFLDFNHSAEIADKLKREDVIGRRLTDMFPGVREFGFLTVLQRVWKTGQPQHFPAAFYQDNNVSGWRENYVYRLPTGEVIAIYEDVTERKQAEFKLVELNEKLNYLLNSMAEGAYGVDTNGNCTFVNHSFLRILGYGDAGEIVGKHIHELIHHSLPDGRHYPSEQCQMYSAFRSQQSTHVDNEVFWRKDGVAVQVEYWSQPIMRDGNLVGAIATFLDITDRRKSEALIYNLAFFDTLTQLPNRQLFNDRLTQSLAATKRSGRCGAVMFIDLDNFKTLNDTHGHAMGDLLLIEVARRITSCLRELDTVARFGGDEFVVLLDNLGEEEVGAAKAASLIAEKIRTSLLLPYFLTKTDENAGDVIVEHQCTSSIGVALFKESSKPDDILKMADVAMYQAKHDGRNLVRVYSN
ncbi:MAG: sensor domain-containing diguanylate cyclase [Sideroxydans sp.]|jgi:diguanylate cyclase (GGDEF)-like protein/PAS domain S-box-containing protein